jgi:hypothetical protein
MRLILVILILALSAVGAVAQDQSARDGASERSHFGAVVVKYTMIRGQGAIMLGGRGGRSGKVWITATSMGRQLRWQSSWVASEPGSELRRACSRSLLGQHLRQRQDNDEFI